MALTSTNEELYNNPSESLAEGKTTFELVSKDEIPLFGKLTGASIDINKEIADALSISLTTVISHRKNISEKLGIRSLSGLTVYAVMRGYVEPDSL